MSYYRGSYPRGRYSNVYLDPLETLGWLNYEQRPLRLEQLEQSQPARDGLAPMHPSYVPWRHPRFPRRRNHWHPHVHLPVKIDTPGVEEATYPGYSPWSRRYRSYHPHVHRPGSLGFPGAFDPRWPASYGKSGYLSAIPETGLPNPYGPYPNPPPPPPPPPPSGPRPLPRPNPQPRPAPGPKRQNERQTTIPEYYPKLPSTDSGYQTGSSTGQGQSRSGRTSDTDSVTTAAPQQGNFRRASVEDAGSESEGARTPTQSDYANNHHSSQRESTPVTGGYTSAKGPTTTSVGENAVQPENSSVSSLQSKHRSDLASWQWRAQPKGVPNESSYWNGFEHERYKCDPRTGRWETVGTKADEPVKVDGRRQQGVGVDTNDSEKYGFQVPRSPH